MEKISKQKVIMKVYYQFLSFLVIFFLSKQKDNFNGMEKENA